MVVRDIIKAAALQLGMYEDYAAYEKKENPAFEGEVATLVECFNTVENELALDYLPLFAEARLKTPDGKLYFKQFNKKITRVVKVKDLSGTETAYRIFPEYLEVAPGEYDILYAYAPAQKTLGDKTDFQLRVSERLFAYGIAAEYLLVKGAYQEAAAWDAKYKEAIAAAYRAGNAKKIASRRWV